MLKVNEVFMDDKKEDSVSILIETHESCSESYESEPSRKNPMLLSLQNKNKNLHNRRGSGDQHSRRGSGDQHGRRGSGNAAYFMAYSSGSFPELEVVLDLDPRLVETIGTKKKKVQRRPSQRRSSSSLFLPKPKKKVRFSDTVTIRRISVRKGLVAPPPKTFMLIAHLKEIWKKLDQDNDNYLNIKELGHFVNKVWEDEDVEEMLKGYSKEPDKGMEFTEWCALLKEEDDQLTDLIDDLYAIFVIEDDKDEDDEKQPLII